MALTIHQLTVRLQELNKQKKNCESERTKYKTSLTNANKLVQRLNESVKYLNNTNDYMKKYFTINGKTADGGKINSIKESTNEIIRKIKTRVIPSIDSSISNLNFKINKIDKERQLVLNEINLMRKS